MNTLKAGFARAVITPPMGIFVAGYYQSRYADGVLDDIEVNTLAVEAGGKKAILTAVDLCSLGIEMADMIRESIAEKLGIPKAAVYLSATHTHTGPATHIPGSGTGEKNDDYNEFLVKQVVACAQEAVWDLQPAKMGWKVGTAPNIAFVRRFRMKDGGVRTNPGVGNPDIVAPIGDVDERVNILRFDREDDSTIVLCNFGCHPDVVGGCKISADWPGFLRRTVEKSLDNTRCLFFNGAEGDVNHVNVKATDGDHNDMFHDFDDVDRGYGHARFMGRVVAGAVLQTFDKVNYREVDCVDYKERTIDLPSNMPRPEDIERAHLYNDLHKAGKDDQIPFEGMELTTVVAEAARMVNLEHGPESFPLTISTLRIGPVAFVGIQGEPFTGIGRGLKEAEGWEMVLPTCNTNGKEGYFPMQDAYDEGGYEARSSIFKAGVGELLIKEGKALLAELKK